MIAGVALALAATHGVATELFMRKGLAMSAGATAAFTLLFCLLAYVWYHQDAKLRGWSRRSAMSAAVILLPFLGLPWYAASSRPAGSRVGSVLRVLAFLVLLLITSVATGITLQVATSTASQEAPSR